MNNEIAQFVKNKLELTNNNIIQTIKALHDVYGYDLVEGKKIVESVQNNTSEDIVHIKKTIIVSSASSNKVGSTIGRATIGNVLFGTVGAVAAGLTAKKNETTTFQIIYSDGSQETKTVKNNSRDFDKYCKYLK